MPEFTYTGIDRTGKRVHGRLEAPNEGELRMLLRTQGIRPTRIAKASVLNTNLGSLLRGGGVPAKELAIFTRQMHVLISSGIPMVQSLEILSDQTPDPILKNVIDNIRDRVSQGAFLWEAMSGHPKSFPRVYVSLIRAGESSGAMEAILSRLSSYLENTQKLMATVKAAMMYPVIVTLVGIGVVSVMLTFVIPKFASFLKESGKELPGPTQFVIDLSDFMIAHFFHIIGGTVVLVFLIIRYVKTEEGRGVVDRLLFRFPIFGEVLQKSGVARFSRTMGTLLASGINLIDAVEICRTTVNNVVIEEAVGTIRRELEGGKTMGMALGKLKVIPRMATQMVTVGESTGNLEKMLDRVADIYEGEVETLVGGLSKLIEPIILVVLGGMVAGIMIAMYLPVFKLAGG